MTTAALSVAERVNMLFYALHSSTDPEPTADDVAEALRGRGIEVDADYLTGIRTGRIADPPPTVLAGLAEHFRQEPWYLTDDGGSDRVRTLHIQLDTLAALRDAGVGGVRLRGAPTSRDRQALIDSLRDRQRRTS
ncbi:ESX-1 secretion-associated regulator EspR [Nocardia otitidiscaviarum]|uniref:ESX-1 secretion-associated regulator EspR n=1 Tax=Nocardia otitidiscaviarum TaxID=1823 RepID=A0A379JMA7_9NOCA|nr:hypothetical protein [Nocardia otitidiscaviarum]SUD49570.1 ESX-1 secretion-associated regulator EspR [Nocardia otitidiscaviarum]